MQKNEIEELLKRHSQLTSLESCGSHWVPENKSLKWYLGFFQCLEIHTGIRELFAEEEQEPAYEVLSKQIRSELAKIAGEKSSFSKVAESILEAFLGLLIEKVGLCVICQKLASICDKANQKEMGYLFGQAAKLTQIQKGKK
jgi:dynactin complex subunit